MGCTICSKKDEIENCDITLEKEKVLRVRENNLVFF